jgi:hypothetical protein
MGKGNDGSGWSMSVEPRGRSEPPKASVSKRAGKKKKKWANIEKEARKRPRPPDLSDPAVRKAEREQALAQKPRLIKKGEPDWKPKR